MSKLFLIYVLFIVLGGAYADITFTPSCLPGDVFIDTVEVEGITYHTVSVTDFPLPMSGEYSAGLPSVPFIAQTFLLPPDIAIDTILISSTSWDTLPGKYYLYPAQSGSMEDTTFTLPDTEVYASDDPLKANNYKFKKVFVYNLTGSYMEWRHHDWETGYDCWANMGGPAIGQLDDDTEPEVAYTLEGMCGWRLLSSNEYPEPVWQLNAGVMEENTHSEWDETVRSVTIIGGTTVYESEIQVPFTGFSTLNYGHDPQDNMNVLPGFPTWSEDASFVAPLIVDLDSDGTMECLTSDASGLLTLYEWEGYSTSSGGWPMYQHDPWRTGNYDMQFSDGEELDFKLLGVEQVISDRRIDGNAALTLLAEVEVTGSGVPAPVVVDIRAPSVLISHSPRTVQVADNPSAETTRTSEVELQVRQSSEDVIGYDYNTVGIALFIGNRVLSSSEFPLYDGIT